MPTAVVWLWHLEQVPETTPLCVKNAGVQLVVRWQLLQLTVVGRWFAGLKVDTTRPPGEWHCTHCVGVPRKIPCMWHRSHTTCAWPPLSGKPVLLWSISMSERFERPCGPLPRSATRHRATGPLRRISRRSPSARATRYVVCPDSSTFDIPIRLPSVAAEQL